MEQNDNYDAYVRLAYLTLEDLRTEHLLGAPDYTADIEELEAAVDWDALVDTSHLEPTEEELREAAAEALLKYRAEKAAREAAQQEAGPSQHHPGPATPQPASAPPPAASFAPGPGASSTDDQGINATLGPTKRQLADPFRTLAGNDCETGFDPVGSSCAGTQSRSGALTWESSPYLNFVAPSSQPTAVDVEGDADHGETTIGGQASDALPTITDGHEAEVGQQEVAENEATPKEHCV